MSKLSSNQTKTKSSGSFFRSNPVMNRLNKMDVVSAAPDEKAAGYGRITVKTAYFLLMTVVGMLAYLTLNQLVFSGQAQTLSIAYKGFTFTTSVMTIIFAAVAGVLAIITQLIAAFVPASIPVTGTVYSMCQGFIISFLVFTVIKGYEYLGLLALAITVVVVFTMSILYTTRDTRDKEVQDGADDAAVRHDRHLAFQLDRFFDPAHQTLCQLDPGQFLGLDRSDGIVSHYRMPVFDLRLCRYRPCGREQNACQI